MNKHSSTMKVQTLLIYLPLHLILGQVHLFEHL